MTGLEPNEIARAGIGFVPQGRRLWPSLSVDETLRLSARAGAGGTSWTIERVYSTFPRLAERRGNGGGQLSGGEQQMLAISRALLGNPRLLIMDEPTEGLAPVIVTQVRDLLIRLAADEDLSVLVVEQNIGVATSVSESVAIMVNGRINRIIGAAELARDRDLQQRLLGVGRHADAEAAGTAETSAGQVMPDDPRVYHVSRQGAPAENERAPVYRLDQLPNRWGLRKAQRPSDSPAGRPDAGADPVFAIPFAERIGRTALVAGTFDTKSAELLFMRDRLRELKIPVRTIDLSTSGKMSRADVTPMQVASMHPLGSSAVFSGERGDSVTAMGIAFGRWIERERGIGGVISAGGSGGTSLATAGMRRLPLGIPKVMVSTVASGQVAPYVGASDIMMLYSVADVQGLNLITEQVLGNAVNALAGMIAGMPGPDAREARRRLSRPAIGLTMFGVTTPAVQAISKRLEGDFDCLVFHATGTGGRSMENLADSGMLSGFIDLTTTEVADMVAGGVFAADSGRFGSAIRTGLPYVGSTGALDMVNFGPRDTVPARYNNRRFVIHNPDVTLMRTTRDENRTIGEWIGGRLNQMEGPVRMLLPERGVSMLDAPGKAFYDPEADNALFEALEKNRPADRAAQDRAGRCQYQRRHIRCRCGGRLSHHQSAPRTEGVMPAIDRQTILSKLQGMKQARVPIIGGGAGTGLSAKCEEAGGIDLIVIYNSGRYRMAGRGSLAGVLAYGNANDIVREMAHEVLPAVSRTPVLAGVNGTDPFCLFDPFLDELKRLGFSGVQNFPTVGLIDGLFRANLEETGMSYALEVEMIALAHRKNMLTTPYVFCAADAGAMAKAGAGHRRLSFRPHDRRNDRGAHGTHTRGLSGPRRRMGRSRARREPRCDCSRARRSGGRARRCRIHSPQHQTLSRLLWRIFDGAPPGRSRDDGANEEVQDDHLRVSL